MYEEEKSMQDADLRRRWGFWWQWAMLTTLGQWLGLGFAIAFGGSLSELLEKAADPARLVWGMLIILFAGAMAGMIIGWFQWQALSHYLSNLPLRRWVLASSFGATISWSAGIALGSRVDFVGTNTPVAVQVSAVLLFSALLGGVIGLCQWCVLYQIVASTLFWVPANALAWTVGLALAFTGMGLLPESLPWIQIDLYSILICALASLIIVSIQGMFLVCMLPFSRL